MLIRASRCPIPASRFTCAYLLVDDEPFRFKQLGPMREHEIVTSFEIVERDAFEILSMPLSRSHKLGVTAYLD